MTKVEWKPIEIAPVPKLNQSKWLENSFRCIGATKYGFIGVMSYSYTQKGKGRWMAYYGVVNPTHWAEMPNLHE